MPQPLADILYLSKHYPRHNGIFAKSKESVRAVDGVDLQIFPGETVALIGESGSGKTTLAHCLFRIVEPTAGKIYFKGEEVGTMAGENLQRFRREAQLIFQDAEAALDPRQTIGSAVAEPIITHGVLEKNRPGIVLMSCCSKSA
jgi:ABC-type glutathione transport system ATPase component